MARQHPSTCIILQEKDYSVLFSSTDEEFKYMVKQLEDMGFISSEDTAGVMTSIYVQAKGWERISELSGTTIGSKNQAFVAMGFRIKLKRYMKKSSNQQLTMME